MADAKETSGIAFAAVLIAGLSFWFGTQRADNDAQLTALNNYAQGLAADFGNCENFQTRVLDLRDRGLHEDQIIEVINGEEAPSLEQIKAAEVFEDFTSIKNGPAYDYFYKPGCGDIGPLLRYADGAP